MSTSLSELRTKHQQSWSNLPPWTTTLDAVDAAETSQKHAAELSRLESTIQESASRLDEMKQLLLTTAKERDEAISKYSQLEQQVATLNAQVCELKRNLQRNNNNDDNDNNDVSNNIDDSGENINEDDDDAENQNQDMKKSHQSKSHPKESEALSLLKNQNEQLLEKVSSLTQQLAKHNEQQQQNINNQQEDASSNNIPIISNSENVLGNLMSRFQNVNNNDNNNNNMNQSSSSCTSTSSKTAELIESLRQQLAYAEERALVAERVAARAVASSSSNSESSSCDNNNNNNENQNMNSSRAHSPTTATSTEHNSETHQQNSLPKRRQRGNTNNTNNNDNDDENNVENQQGDFDESLLFEQKIANKELIPQSTTEMLHFWTYGQKQINSLQQKLQQETKKAQDALLKAQSAEALSRSRSELVNNIQTLATELEASRDECTRLRCSIDGLELEASVLTQHLTAALAVSGSSTSKEEIEQCARDLKEAAAKTATIATLTAPEISVAKDAMKKNQALQHELSLMAKRRDQLKEEIGLKQITLEHLSNNIWLKNISGSELRGKAETIVSSSSSSSNKNQKEEDSLLFDESNVTTSSTSTSPSTSSLLNEKVFKMQKQLEQQELTILNLQRKNATLVQICTNSQQEQEQEQDNISDNNNNNNNGEDSAAQMMYSSSNNNVNTNNNNYNTVEFLPFEEGDIFLKQDSTIQLLKQKLFESKKIMDRQQTFGKYVVSTVSDVTNLVRQLMQLVDSLLSTHYVFASKSKQDNNNNETEKEEEGLQQGRSKDSASSSSSLTTEETSVIRSILSTLEEHKTLVSDRLSLLEGFKEIGSVSREIAVATALEDRAEELSSSKKQVAELMQKLELVQKEAGQQEQWYSAVDESVSDLKKQGQDLNKDNLAAWSLFSELALHRLDSAVKNTVQTAKPSVAALTSAAASVTASSEKAVSSSVSVDSAKKAISSGSELLSSSSSSLSAAAATAVATEKKKEEPTTTSTTTTTAATAPTTTAATSSSTTTTTTNQNQNDLAAQAFSSNKTTPSPFAPTGK